MISSLQAMLWQTCKDQDTCAVAQGGRTQL